MPQLHHEVVIAGFGGQGVVLAGRLLASAALAEGMEVVWAPSYGPEMRGGEVHCTVIVSSSRIGSPEVSLADSLLTMDQTSARRFVPRVKPGGLVVCNTTLVKELPACDQCRLLRIPATEAAEALGEPRAANVVMLGAFLAEETIVSLESLEATIRAHGGDRRALIEVNLRALDRGAELARAAG